MLPKSAVGFPTLMLLFFAHQEMYEEAKKMENELRSIQDEIQELKGKSDTHAKVCSIHVVGV